MQEASQPEKAKTVQQDRRFKQLFREGAWYVAGRKTVPTASTWVKRFLCSHETRGVKRHEACFPFKWLWDKNAYQKWNPGLVNGTKDKNLQSLVVLF